MLNSVDVKMNIPILVSLDEHTHISTRIKVRQAVGFNFMIDLDIADAVQENIRRIPEKTLFHVWY